MVDKQDNTSVRFYESELEGIAIDLLSDEESGMSYIFTPADELNRELDEVILLDDLREYLLRRPAPHFIPASQEAPKRLISHAQVVEK